jgi:hypothetical protein
LQTLANHRSPAFLYYRRYLQFFVVHHRLGGQFGGQWDLDITATVITPISSISIT